MGAPAPNQCQIITFLILKTDDIAKLRAELKSILLEIPSNKLKGTYIKLVHVWSSFYCFTWALKENVGGLLEGGGGGKGFVCPSKIIGGEPGTPLPTLPLLLSSYAYVL